MTEPSGSFAAAATIEPPVQETTSHRGPGVVHRVIWHPVVRSLVCLITVVITWAVVVHILKPSPISFPSPARVWDTARTMLKDGFEGTSLLGHVWASTRRVGIGFGLSLVVGIPLGVAMGTNELIRRISTTYIALFRPVPPFAWLAILVVWFGIGETPKVLIIFVGSVTIIALNTMDGVRRVPRQFQESGQALGASRLQVFRFILVPAAVPQILNGARVALVVAWTAVLAAELVAATAGIGVIILDSSNYLRTDQAFVGIFLIAICGGITDWVIGRIQKAVEPWSNR
jgi:taurine transport system permease protein